MNKYIFLLALVVVMAGCTTKYDAEEAQACAYEAQAMTDRIKAEQEAEADARASQQAAIAAQFQAQAQEQQALAAQAQAQAAITQAQEQTKMIAAARSNGGVVLIVIVFVLAGLIAWRWSLGAVAAVATGQPSQMVLLPGDPGFNRALRLAAQERGARAVKRDGQYYLVAGATTQEVRRLTVTEDR